MLLKKQKKSEIEKQQQRLEAVRKKSLKTVTSTQAYNPVADVKDGVVITKDGRYVKILKVTPINFQLRSQAEQNGIISFFAALLRIMPAKFQFKVVSRPADVSQFEQRIEAEMETEKDNNCRVLQHEQLELIRQIGSDGITRDFYIIYEFNGSQRALGHSPTFHEIVSSLDTTAARIRSMLAQCGNEVESPSDQDEAALSILYSILCRRQSIIEPYEDHVLRILAERSFTSGIGEGSDEDFYIPITDFISPVSINTKRSSKYIIVDDLYYAFGYIPSGAYAPAVVGGWVSLLVNLGDGIDVDLFANKQPIDAVQRKLQYGIRYNRVKMKDTDDTSLGYNELGNQINAGYYLQNGIASGDDFYYMSILMTVVASSADELQQKVSWLQATMTSYTLQLKMCNFRQLEAFESVLPLCKESPALYKKSRRNILTTDLASVYPFTSYEMTDKNGILLGVNKGNSSLIFVDIFDSRIYKNANIAILGTSGAGKTYTLQCMALRMRQQGIQTFILAPDKGHEFKRACVAVGGQYIKLSPGSGQNINIMEIRKSDTRATELLDGTNRKESILLRKIQALRTFFSLLVPDMDYEESQALDDALLRSYAKYGITPKNRSLLMPDNPNRYKQMPVLQDLQEKLRSIDEDRKTRGEEPVATRLISVLNFYVSGSARSFNLPTNVNLDNKYIVLDISELTKELLPVGMFIALDYVWDKAREDRTAKKAIFLDELWTLIGAKSSKQAAEFVLEIFKVIRGYGGSAIAATQDLTDFFALDNGAYGKGIINNSKTKVIMNLEPEEAETVASTLNLTETEIQQITRFQRGEALLAASTNHVVMQVTASPAENALITTDRAELSALAAQMAESQG